MDALVRRRVTVVLPVFNEADNVGPVYMRLAGVAAQRPTSTSSSSTSTTAAGTPRSHRLVHLRAATRGFGPAASRATSATSRRHRRARPADDADAVVVMDTDLQDPPRVSLQMIERWEDGVDVVYAQRRTRQDRLVQAVTAYAFYWVLTGCSDARSRATSATSG